MHCASADRSSIIYEAKDKLGYFQYVFLVISTQVSHFLLLSENYVRMFGCLKQKNCKPESEKYNAFLCILPIRIRKKMRCVKLQVQWNWCSPNGQGLISSPMLMRYVPWNYSKSYAVFTPRYYWILTSFPAQIAFDWSSSVWGLPKTKTMESR